MSDGGSPAYFREAKDDGLFISSLHKRAEWMTTNGPVMLNGDDWRRAMHIIARWARDLERATERVKHLEARDTLFREREKQNETNLETWVAECARLGKEAVDALKAFEFEAKVSARLRDVLRQISMLVRPPRGAVDERINEWVSLALAMPTDTTPPSVSGEHAASSGAPAPGLVAPVPKEPTHGP